MTTGQSLFPWLISFAPVVSRAMQGDHWYLWITFTDSDWILFCRCCAYLYRLLIRLVHYFYTLLWMSQSLIVAMITLSQLPAKIKIEHFYEWYDLFPIILWALEIQTTCMQDWNITRICPLVQIPKNTPSLLLLPLFSFFFYFIPNFNNCVPVLM